MGSEEAQTEKLIKDKARILFFQKGLLNATTQEIADEAGINRALIHYYFRSRDHLRDLLLDETLQGKKERTRSILSSNLPFRQKIAHYIHVVVDYGLNYPYLDNFIISETARNPRKVREFCSRNRLKFSDLIRVQLEEEIRHKKIAPISAEHFMINLSSMCNYPLLAKSVMQIVYGMNDAAYAKFLIERKRIIYMSIFHEEMPELIELKEHHTNHA